MSRLPLPQPQATKPPLPPRDLEIQRPSPYVRLSTLEPYVGLPKLNTDVFPPITPEVSQPPTAARFNSSAPSNLGESPSAPNMAGPFEPGISSKGPIDESDTLWENEGDSTKWHHCPSIIPEKWKQWWCRPVCGAEQSRVRYDLALTHWSELDTPLPYESLAQYEQRRYMKDVALIGPLFDWLETRPGLKIRWDGFYLLYEPWRAVDGIMPTSAGEIVNDADKDNMLRLHSTGEKWPYIHRHFPHLSEDSCNIEFLRMVADELRYRAMGRSDGYLAISAASNGLPGRHAWTINEKAVVLKLRKYGLTWFAISEELWIRSSLACYSMHGPLLKNQAAGAPSSTS